MLKHGASPHCRDWRGNTPLHVATADAAEALLAHGAMCGARNYAGETPLHTARDSRVTHLLLTHGADVNARDDHGQTPLHRLPIYQGGEGVIATLLAHGADPMARTKDGRTPLHDKVATGVMAINILLDGGSDVNEVDNQGRTLLDLALEWTHEDGGARASALTARGGKPGKTV